MESVPALAQSSARITLAVTRVIRGREPSRCYPKNILNKRFRGSTKVFYPGFLFFERWVCPADRVVHIVYISPEEESRYLEKTCARPTGAGPFRQKRFVPKRLLCPVVCAHSMYINIYCTRFGNKGELSRRRSHHLSSSV